MGCALAPRCLTCPLPICVEDLGSGGAHAYRVGLRDIKLVREYEARLITETHNVILDSFVDREKAQHKWIIHRLGNGRRWRVKLNWDGED